MTRLPPEFVARIGELEPCTYVDDVMVIFHRIEQAFKDAEEYVWRMTDRYILTAVPVMEDALQRGVEFRLLEPRDIVVPPEFDNGPILREALRSRQFRNKVIDQMNVFMAVTEKEVAGICFPGADGRIDYRGFVSDDPEVHRWATDLYEYYWEQSERKTTTTPPPSYKPIRSPTRRHWGLSLSGWKEKQWQYHEIHMASRETPMLTQMA